MKQSIITFVISLWVLLACSQAWAGPKSEYEPYVAPDRAGDPNVSLFVLLAYSSIWLVVLLFVLSVWRRQRQVEAEMRAIQAELGGDR